MLVAVLAGCVTGGAGGRKSSPAAESRSPAAPQAGDVWEQQVSWLPCDGAELPENAECAAVAAPLNWDAPDGERIELALARVKAPDGAGRLGSLLVNPGGPGGSGKGFLPQALDAIGAEVQARYDIVGFDPRGVGESTPITCYETTEERDAHFAATWPRTLAGFEESLAVAEPFAKACAQNTGPLLGHVDTISAAKDMELLRTLLGDEQLNFLGYSYGTLLGAVYAELFPAKVGRLVLDGAIDPSVSASDHEVEQAAGFEAALGAYLADCVGTEDCPFGGAGQQALDRIHQLLVEIEADPLSAGPQDSRELTVPLALNGILITLYDDESWPFLSQALTWALDYGDGAALMALSDIYLDRQDGSYQSNQMEAFVAINCLDDRLPSDLASAEAHAAALAAASPTFGEFWAYGEKQCEVWPYPQVSQAQPITAAGAAPIIVIGTTGDPATPYHGAVALAEQLDSGVLITFDGEGHTAYGRSNGCVDQAVDRYLLEGEAPSQNLAC
jgi:pimeloyl-ACP methyl ester carboxylesterase